MMKTIERSNASMNNDRKRTVARLMQIDGIAEKTAIALYEIGIRSYVDLIEYLSKDTAEEISEALRDRGVKRPPAFIHKEDWVAQAKKLCPHKYNPHKLPKKEAKATERPEKLPRLTDSSEHNAVFTLLFDLLTDEDGEPILQTTVYDEKNSGKEEVFQGNDTAPWVNWIIKRAKLPISKKTNFNKVEIATEEGVSLTLAPVMARIDILEVRLSETPTPLDAWKKNLLVEIRFQVTGAEAETLTEDEIPFRIEVYTINLQSRTSNLVAYKQSNLQPQTIHYTSQMKFTMPTIGQYELSTMVILLPPGELIGNYHGPTFKVVI